MKASQYLKHAWHRSLFTTDQGKLSEFGTYLIITLLALSGLATSLLIGHHLKGAIIVVLGGCAVFLYCRICYMNTPVKRDGSE